jgi:Wax ester synthase-like Acyl-CoA acyltransferase domain
MILLDRARPLWQFYVIEGLQGGRFAVYAKLHHAAVDGGAGMVIMETIFSSSPEPGHVPPPPRSSNALSSSAVQLANQRVRRAGRSPRNGRRSRRKGRRCGTFIFCDPCRMR